jgi:hypothetical protein
MKMKQRAIWRTSRHWAAMLSRLFALSIFSFSALTTYNRTFKAYNGVVTPVDTTMVSLPRGISLVPSLHLIYLYASYLDSDERPSTRNGTTIVTEQTIGTLNLMQ